MRAYIVGLLAAAVMMACGVVQAGPITYSLSFGSGALDKLTGTITTDGRIGALIPENITEWSFLSVGSVVFTLGSHDLGSLFNCLGGCGLTASATALEFDFASHTGLHWQANPARVGTGDGGVVNIVGSRYAPPGWVSANILDEELFGLQPVFYMCPCSATVGVAVPGQIVPEPSSISFALLGLALVGCLVFWRKRVRGQQSTAV